MYDYNRRFMSVICILLCFLSFYCLPHYISQYCLSKSVFNSNSKDIVFHEDLNGDGKKDTILIKHSNSSLSGEVNLNKSENYSLICNKAIPTMGEYCFYWPIRISTIDLSRDNNKEIILQSSYENKPIQHIFSWDKTGYLNIFSSENNIIGFIDSSNSKTPKLISGNFSKGRISTKSYIFNGKEVKEFSDTLTENLPGLDTISNFICMIESFPDPYLSVPNYFYSEISTTDLETIFRLANGSNFLKFQDAYFTDLAWYENGKISCENWLLNFKKINTQDNNKISNLTVNLMINKYEDTDFPYKITSVNVY